MERRVRTRAHRALIWGGAAALVATLWNGASVVSSAPQAGEQGPTRYAYLVGCNKYLKIDTATQKIVAQGSVVDDPSTEPVRVERGNVCQIAGVQFDPQAGVIYGLAPDQQQPPDAEGNSYHWIVGLRLPNFALVSKTLKTYSDEEPPALFLNPDAKELLLADEARKTMEYYEVPQLKLLRSEHDEDTTGFTKRAYWWHEGNEIVDDWLGIRDPKGRLIKSVVGGDLLTDALRQEFRSLEIPCLGDRTKKCLGMSYADSADGRMLFVVQGEIPGDLAVNGSGVAVYSISRDMIVSSFPIAYPATTMELAPTVHLTPDGERVVVEQYNWTKSSESGREVRFETGKIAVYDVERGELFNTITLTPPPGHPAHLIGFSPDSSLMYYAAEGRVYAVDLTGAKAPVVIPIEGYPAGKLFFANQ